MGSDQGDKGIHGFLVTSPTSLSTYCHLSTQASMHAHYIFACLRPYLSSMGSDQEKEVCKQSLQHLKHLGSIIFT